VADVFTERYRDLLTGWYDCVDRIVLNAYYPMGSTAGGFRTWWRRLVPGSDAEADAVLDNAHLMRLAGHEISWSRAQATAAAICRHSQASQDWPGRVWSMPRSTWHAIAAAATTFSESTPAARALGCIGMRTA
jgi:hypothetical protein